MAAVGMKMSLFARAEVMLIWIQDATAVSPTRLTTLFVGRIRVPQKFFVLWKILTCWEALAARKTVFVSSVKVATFMALLASVLSTALNAAMFMLP